MKSIEHITDEDIAKEFKCLFTPAYRSLEMLEKILPNLLVAIQKKRRGRLGFPPYDEKYYEWRAHECERSITNALSDIDYVAEHLYELEENK